MNSFDPFLAGINGGREVDWFALKEHFTFVRYHCPRDRFDQRRFASSVVPDYGEDFAWVEIEIAVIECCDLAITLNQASAL